MVRDIDDLLPQVLRYVPKCPEPTALNFIREAAREFCAATRCWRESDSFEVATPDCEGVSTIPDAAIVAIEAATFDEQTVLLPVTVGWLDNKFPRWDQATEDSAPPRYIAQLGEGTVTVVPRATGTLSLRLVLKPSIVAVTLPAILVENYSTEIGAGAVSKVLQLPDPDIQNPQLALKMQADWRRYLDTTKGAVSRGQHRARTRTVATYF